MAPAGDWTTPKLLLMLGADAVYFGLDKLNMRAKAKNFSLEDLTGIVEFCKANKVRTYLTINSIVFEEEIPELEELIIVAKNANVDRIICWDLSVAELCSKHDYPFCISTQGSVSNSLAASVYKKLGAVRIVLARECSLKRKSKRLERTQTLKLKHSFTVQCVLQLAEDVL